MNPSAARIADRIVVTTVAKTVDPERCLPLFALNAVRRPKFLFILWKVVRFIATNASNATGKTNFNELIAV